MGEIKPTKTNIRIEIVKEKLYDINKKGKREVVKDPEGNEQYKRNDLNGLMSLLSKMDTRMHTLRELKFSVKIRDKIREAYLNDDSEIELTVSEGEFLKSYLRSFKEKDGKDIVLAEYEIRTLIGILEQFGELVS